MKLNPFLLISLILLLSSCASQPITDTTVNKADAQGYSEELEVLIFKKKRYFTAAKLLATDEFKINAGDHQGKTLLYQAVRKADLKALDFLLEHGASPNIISDFGTPLQFAAMNNQQKTETTWRHDEQLALKIVQRLVKNGAQINLTGDYAKTPLMFAVAHDNLIIAKYLLMNGADLSLKDASGNTALQQAKKRNFRQMEQLLLSFL